MRKSLLATAIILALAATPTVFAKGKPTVELGNNLSFATKFVGTAGAPATRLGAQDDRRESPGYPQRTEEMSSSAEGDTFVITTTTYYYGPTGIGLPSVNTQTGTSIMELRRTDNPEELSGEYYGETTHFITGNEAGSYVVLQPKPFVVTGELTARRVGEGPAAVVPWPPQTRRPPPNSASPWGVLPASPAKKTSPAA